MTQLPKISGSCLCGDVQFEIEGNFDRFYLCHCDRCRKDTGSAHAANLFSRTARLTFRSGAEHVRTFTLPGTPHTKTFCERCGSALPSRQLEGKLLMVPAGSLDDAVPRRPDAHLFTACRANWDHDLHQVPTVAGLPAES